MMALTFRSNVVLSLAFVVGWLSTLTPPFALAQSNVVVIVSDDAGWADFGFMRSAHPAADPGSDGAVPTPNLDALASRGVTFTDAYTSPVCSASRAMITTGQYGARFGYTQNIRGDEAQPIDTVFAAQGLPTEAVTIWERMQAEGYDTAAIGKWHLGKHASGSNQLGNRPEHQGIETFQGLWDGGRSYWVGSEESEGKLLRETISNGAGVTSSESIIEGNYSNEYATDIFGDLSADYIKSKAGGTEPFFLYSSFTAPHFPREATASDLAFIDSLGDPGFTENRRLYAAIQYALDRNVGKIIDALEDPAGDGTGLGNDADNLLDDTLILFINDNGGDCDCEPSGQPAFANNGALKEGKNDQFEGGVRVPMIIAGAGVDAAQQGTVSDALVHAVDIVPTAVVGAAGGSISSAEVIDGKNLLPHINGTASQAAHDDLFLPLYKWKQSAVRMGKWKYMYFNTGWTDFGEHQLYDLDADIGENNNVAGDPANAAVVEAAHQLLASYHVQMAKPKHDFYDGSASRFDHFRFREESFSAASFSTPNAWTNGDTEIGTDTAWTFDGYANNEMTFRAKASGDYTLTNDLESIGGFSYMANRINLESAAGPLSNSRIGTLNGRPILMTNDLDGNAPQFNLNATDALAKTFAFNVDLDVEIYDHLTIQGNGNQTFVVNGEIREFRGGRNITKLGSSELILAGGVDISGTFEIAGGSVTFTHGQMDGNLTVRSSSNIFVGGTDSGPGASTMQLEVDGDYQQQAGAVLSLDLLDTNNFDALSVNGSASLGGLLFVDEVTGFAPSLGDSYTLLASTEGVSGRFADAILPTLSGMEWLLEYSPTDVELRVIYGADFNADGYVDGRDFSKLQRGYGLTGQLNNNMGDADGNGTVDENDLRIWQLQYGRAPGSNLATIASVPEPASAVMTLCGGVLSTLLVSRRRFSRAKPVR